jgi:hypothetical protein
MTTRVSSPFGGRAASNPSSEVSTPANDAFLSTSVRDHLATRLLLATRRSGLFLGTRAVMTAMVRYVLSMFEHAPRTLMMALLPGPVGAL